jgi:hypothetical protein
MCLAAAVVRHREDVVWREQPERSERDRDSDDQTEEHVGRIVLGEVHPGEPHENEEDRRDSLADFSQAARRNECVQNVHQSRREHGHGH